MPGSICLALYGWLYVCLALYAWLYMPASIYAWLYMPASICLALHMPGSIYAPQGKARGITQGNTRQGKARFDGVK